MKINWKIRIKNPTFLASVAVSFFVPILAHAGYAWNQVDTWPELLSLVCSAISSPVAFVAIIVSVWNAIYDPTTKGITDSAYALTKETVNDTPEVK